jgi:TonB family protein
MTSVQFAYRLKAQHKGGLNTFKMRMKNVVAIAFVLVVTAISGAAQDQNPPNSQPAAPAHLGIMGADAIDFALNDLDGNKVELQKLRGKVVLLNFWDSRCSPCVAALPDVEKLSKEFKDKGLVTLGVDGENAQDARKFVKNKGYSFATLIDEGREVSRKYEISEMPHFIIINREGKVKWRMSISGYGPGPVRKLRDVVEMILNGMEPPLPFSHPSPNIPIPQDVREAVDTPANKALLARAIKRVMPRYSREASAARAQGVVLVEVTVSESGKVIEARAVSGPELLREPAIQAAKQWEFSPAEATVKGLLFFTLATHSTYRY